MSDQPYDWEQDLPELRYEEGSNTGIVCRGGNMTVENCPVGTGATVNIVGDDDEWDDD